MERDVTPSATITASGVITAKRGILHGIIFVTDGTNAVTVNLYDNASAASGDKLIPTDTIITSSGTDRLQSIGFNPPARFENGCYIELTTSGTVKAMAYVTND